MMRVGFRADRELGFEKKSIILTTRSGLVLRLKNMAIQTKIVLLVGIILAGIVYKHVWSRQYTDWGRVHEQEVIEDTLLLQRDLQAIVRDLEGIVSLFKSSDFVSRNGFKAYVRPILEKQKFVKAFKWIPLISDKNRESYEKKMRQEGFPGFQIVQHY